jgi:hypothetical protein
MTIILDNYIIPEKGRVDIQVDYSFDINLTAVQAKRLVNSWLLNEVSLLLGAKAATLVIGERPVWRVPVWVGLADMERAEVVGVVDVDVEKGDILAPDACRAEIVAYLETAVKPTLSPHHHPIRELPPDYLDNLTPPPATTPQ